MKNLEFLRVEAQSSERFRPVARSSMQRRLADAGAVFEERDGWLVAARVPGEDAQVPAVRDVTHRHRLTLGSGEGCPLPGGRSFSYEGGDGLDVTALYAGIELEGASADTVLRRLTELDLDELPAVGAVSHVRTFLFRPAPDRFLLFFPQEYGHYLWEVAVDAAEPLGGGPTA